MKYIALFTCITFLFSCSPSEERPAPVEAENFTKEQVDSVLQKYRFDYSSVVHIDSLPKIIIPITTELERRGKRLVLGSYDSYKFNHANYWNFLFYDIPSASSHLLTNEKCNIIDFKTNFKNAGPVIKNSVLYEMVTVDYNMDNYLTSLDPRQLYISDLNGDNLKCISSKKEDLLTYSFVPKTDKIIFKTRRDTNNDHSFDSSDTILWYIVDISKDEKPLEIINADGREEIEQLYFNQWLVKEK